MLTNGKVTSNLTSVETKGKHKYIERSIITKHHKRQPAQNHKLLLTLDKPLSLHEQDKEIIADTEAHGLSNTMSHFLPKKVTQHLQSQLRLIAKRMEAFYAFSLQNRLCKNATP